MRQKGWVGCPVITPNGGDSKGNVRPKSPKDSGLGIYSLPRFTFCPWFWCNFCVMVQPTLNPGNSGDKESLRFYQRALMNFPYFSEAAFPQDPKSM